MDYNDIFKKIGELFISGRDKIILQHIFNGLKKEGFSADEERIRIVTASLDFLGFRYLRSQELTKEKGIDCSTLISQSYWEGAFIGVPFIAENQRLSPGGVFTAFDDLQPADVVYKFKDLSSSPDKKHNHVGLILGRWNNDLYIIESNAKDGCIITTYNEFMTDGGGRSFIRNHKVEMPTRLFNELNSISKLVPKLSRLGAKQHARHGTSGIEHEGIDIYIPHNTPVFSPLNGKGELIELESDGLPGIRITSSDEEFVIVIGNIIAERDLDFVYAGQLIGRSFDFSSKSRIIFPKIDSLGHIHFEVRCLKKQTYWNNAIERNGYSCINGLYAIKMGSICSPVKFISQPPWFFTEKTHQLYQVKDETIQR